MENLESPYISHVAILIVIPLLQLATVDSFSTCVDIAV